MDGVVRRERAADERAGHHGAAALRGEDPVDPQARSGTIRGRTAAFDQRVDLGTHLIDPDALRRRDRHDRGTLEERALDVIGDVHLRQLEQVVVDEVDLRQRDESESDAEQLEDPKVFLRLRLPALGRGDDEDACVHAADAGEHVAQELHVSRNVDEAQLRTRREHGVGEPEIDREAPPLLLLEPVGVGAGECEDERRLAVIDVAGGRDDRHGADSAEPRAAATTASWSGSIARSRARCGRPGCERSPVSVPTATPRDDRRRRRGRGTAS